MKRFNFPRRTRGVALLEVLIAAVVLAGGLIALAQFQGNMLQSSSSSKARANAGKLAQSKIDDLRSFELQGTGAEGVFGYMEIDNDLGGKEVSGTNTPVLANATGIVISGATYELTWDATNYWYCAKNTAPQNTLCTGAAAGTTPDFKDVTVEVKWDDQDGAQSVIVQSVIESSDPAEEGKVLSTSPDSGSAPKVSFTPGAAPEVLPVDLGDNENTETSNPRPSVDVNNDFDNTIATFQTVNYEDIGGGKFQTLSRTEFITVNCQCELNVNTSPATGNTSVKNGKDLNGEFIWKKYSGVVTSALESPFCTACCRDHQEPPACDPTAAMPGEGRNECFDPWRPEDTSDPSPTSNADGYAGSTGNDLNHRHFNIAGVEAVSDADIYVEACRFQRVDGLLRVIQDWRLISLEVFPEDWLSISSNIDLYGAYVGDLVRASVAPGSVTATQPAFSALGIPPGDSSAYLARGIYLDYLDTAQLSDLDTRITAAPTDNTILQDIPFYEINISKLADWTADPVAFEDPPGTFTDYALVTVTNEAIVAEDVGEENYSRGLVTVVDTNDPAVYPAGADLDTFVRAKINWSNAGLLGRGAIDLWDGDGNTTNDPETSPEFDDGYTIHGEVALTAQPGVTIDGYVNPKKSNTNFTLQGTGAAAGYSSTTACSYTNGSGYYVCAVPYNWTGTVTLSHAGGTVYSPATRSYSTSLSANTGPDNYCTNGASPPAC